MVREFAVLAKNHGGWQVETFDPNAPFLGWYPAIEQQVDFEEGDVAKYIPLEPFKTEAEAQTMMLNMKTSSIYRKDVELRVYPVALGKPEK